MEAERVVGGAVAAIRRDRVDLYRRRVDLRVQVDVEREGVGQSAVQGEAAGAASGYRAAGPVGAVVGGALGTATGTLSGTANMLSGSSAPPPACAWGYHWYNGYCYPNR